MTNEELIRRFFLGGLFRNTESYGFSARLLIGEDVDNFALYSKTSQFPMTVKLSKNYYVVATPFVGTNSKHCEVHNRAVITIAEQLKIKFTLSPHADAANFHRYMEERINCNLLALANDLNTGSYVSVQKIIEADPHKPVFDRFYAPEPCFAVPENYQKLMGNIHTLLEWENILELPKNQVSLIDTDETQSLWRWLIKGNPDAKDQALLRNMYTLSKLLAP